MMIPKKFCALAVLAFSIGNLARADDEFSAPLTLRIPKSTPAYQADPARSSAFPLIASIALLGYHHSPTPTHP